MSYDGQFVSRFLGELTRQHEQLSDFMLLLYQAFDTGDDSALVHQVLLENVAHGSEITLYHCLRFADWQIDDDVSEFRVALTVRMIDPEYDVEVVVDVDLERAAGEFASGRHVLHRATGKFPAQNELFEFISAQVDEVCEMRGILGRIGFRQAP